MRTVQLLRSDEEGSKEELKKSQHRRTMDGRGEQIKQDASLPGCSAQIPSSLFR